MDSENWSNDLESELKDKSNDLKSKVGNMRDNLKTKRLKYKHS